MKIVMIDDYAGFATAITDGCFCAHDCPQHEDELEQDVMPGRYRRHPGCIEYEHRQGGTKTMTTMLRELVTDWLRANGYDGLAGDGCGCGLDDLMPCDSPCCDCVAGHRVVLTQEEADRLNRDHDYEFEAGDSIWESPTFGEA